MKKKKNKNKNRRGTTIILPSGDAVLPFNIINSVGVLSFFSLEYLSLIQFFFVPRGRPAGDRETSREKDGGGSAVREGAGLASRLEVPKLPGARALGTRISFV